ncbi:hypothetical protein [Microcoleus sp. Pol12A5]
MLAVPTTNSTVAASDDAGKTSERKPSTELDSGKNRVRVLAAQSVETKHE